MKKILLISFVLLSLVSFSQEKFKKVKPHNAISMSIPESFMVMRDESIADRYMTSRKPTMVYTNDNEDVDLDVNVSINKWGTDVELLKEFYKSTIHNAHKKVEFLQDDVTEINKRKYARLEYKSSFDNKGRSVTKHYTLILFTVIENKVVVTSFRCPQRSMKTWQSVANKIMTTLKMKDKLNLVAEESYTPEEKALEKRKKLQEEKETKKKAELEAQQKAGSK